MSEMTPPKAMDWSAQSGRGPELYQSFMVPGMFTPFARRMIDALGVPAGARVLDVACGTGIVSRTAARAAGPGGAVTGVDMGPPMLAVARAQPAEDGAAPITYLEGNAQELPVQDGAFDRVTCHHGLQFFPDKVGALREMRRALAPGGRAAVAVWGAAERQPHFAVLVDALERHASPELAEMLRSPFAIDEPDVLGGLLDEAGFRGVRVEVHTLPVTFPSHPEFPERILGAGPIAPLFAAAPDAVRRAVADDAVRALAPWATPDGGLASEMTSLVALAEA